MNESKITKRDRKIAEELKRRLADAVSLRDLRVFGSRARGDADEYSDLDVFIEVSRIDPEIKEKIEEIIWEVGFNNLIVISPHIFSQDEIENTAVRSSPILKNITEEGVRV
jgi:predicted nucleotidyltransferase